MNSVPWFLIFSQTLNVALLLFLSIFFLRKKVFSFFNERQKVFLDQQKKSESLILEAKKEDEKIKGLLRRIEENYEKEIEKAKRSAQSKKELLIKEAKKEAQEILKASDVKMKREEGRLLKIIQSKLVKQSFQKAREKLKTSLSDEKVKGSFEEDFLSVLEAKT